MSAAVENKPGYEEPLVEKTFRVRITLTSTAVKSVEQGKLTLYFQIIYFLLVLTL